ncbi:MAG: IclR family transcriptional regulator [Candidatus Korobacteraceae bacterium]|jgi:DNA-binding IclR family transcriptional regulator
MSKIVERTLDVFEMFATEKRRLSLTDMKRLLSIPISSCYDVIHTLEARGYVYAVAPRAGYYPTRRLYNICEVIIAHDSLVQRAAVLLETLKNEIQETVTLVKATGLRGIYLFVVEPEHPIRYSVTVGAEIHSLYATSAGKAILGTLPDDVLEECIKSAELPRMTHKTLTAKNKLLADIRLSRKRGWYLNQEESIEGVVTVSGVFMWNNAVHIVTVAGPATRMEEKIQRAAQQIVRTCKELGDASN